ncbi:hypothetical protein HYPDE_32528 [Hyphomicrobium denitrificans 1NES1]|uniref:Uncharacterized protein n=1 Tax=Hyphomicrobium denitrificans 1NES1 TaxID=670307 RepID=N0B596_9HYPH|nr:hypothetical protein HYPDE_32528 [Hyphomicrobium denitrificans 1NES1]
MHSALGFLLEAPLLFPPPTPDPSPRGGRGEAEPFVASANRAAGLGFTVPAFDAEGVTLLCEYSLPRGRGEKRWCSGKDIE